MKFSSAHPKTHSPQSQKAAAFTLVEMLVVLVVIGILAAIGLPALKGFGESNVMAAASRQLKDDISYARQRAINTRSRVWIVFVPPQITDPNYTGILFNPTNTLEELRLMTNLLGGQYRTYALYTERHVGDQPGKSSRKYLTDWKTLPEGVFISTNKFVNVNNDQRMNLFSVTNRPFHYYDTSPFASQKPFVPAFPLAESTTNFPFGAGIPCIGFNSSGQLISEAKFTSPPYQDVIIPLSRGSIFYARDREGRFIPQPADAQETLSGNNSNNWTRIRVDWLTGRPKIDVPPLL
ncbi:MAG: pilus assembly FimT family protein [Limisphaerales bacterium]